jgi:hypothetical protein
MTAQSPQFFTVCCVILESILVIDIEITHTHTHTHTHLLQPDYKVRRIT